ncbi:MAG: hypothetical protein JWR05_748 [Mucilaginibacter sp.]|nr:hypothetical protein [Mucilaginibacter sp.]
MKQIIIAVFITAFFLNNSNAQSQKSKEVSINGISLCQTTLQELQQLSTDFKEVEVEEMDLAKGCYGQDSRFIAGKGYTSAKYLGLIFQKDPNSDFISKVRLTKQYKGRLPDGNMIDMGNFLLRDLLKLYPQFKNKWGSRGCADYWNFSNDTISFFVKIDKTKKPQFPIDEAYYMDKPVVGIDLVSSCYGVQNGDGYHVAEVNTDPVYIIDSVRVYKSDLMKYDPNQIASLTVYKDTNAVKKFGDEARNGLIYIESKGFAKNRYWKYFKLKSSEYAKIVSSSANDLNIQYILNKRILKENFEGDLASINDSIFKGLQIISKEQLVKDYKISDKDYGVIISSDIPADLHNGKNKF